ncbi:hypothetical protein BJ508DRAFT_322064 [Ascobolus immersus RN42]|uniref:BTB domain-containing protein n=1 Tax=Ascobolus immersus RN42 TaxID=1160509 RepID=A0A3N4IJT5_ASCIM|nr:hypothetical protein BJ508DRAFT_322064 [Ascobolus immersus RN42]
MPSNQSNEDPEPPIEDYDSSDSESPNDDLPNRPPRPGHNEHSFERIPSLSTDVKSAASDLFMQNKYSDFRIICDGHVFPAHKAIVCQQSEFFSAMFRVGLKECEDGVVTINEERPATIYRLLSFLYLGFYNQMDLGYQGFATTKFCTKAAVLKQALMLQTGGYGDNEPDFRHTFVWATRKAYKLFKGRQDPMRLLQMHCLVQQYDINTSPPEFMADMRLQAAREEDAIFGADFTNFYEWERAFRPSPVDMHSYNNNGYYRPRKWQKNAGRGWNVIFEWAPSRSILLGLMVMRRVVESLHEESGWSLH